MLKRDKEPYTTHSETHNHKKVNLPKLTLPSFSRDIIQWYTFIEAFKAAIGNDDILNDVQKFQYLQSPLTGEAARTVAGLPLTTANYFEALSLLQAATQDYCFILEGPLDSAKTHRQ